MIANQIALVRRELWEHRSIYIAPATVAVIMSLAIIAFIVGISTFNKEIDVAIFSASNLAGDAERRAVLTGFFVGTSWVFVITLSILTVFYCLDSLYAERKDRSILFWRSLPITDSETVVSKLITAAVILPLIFTVAIVLTNLVNLVLLSIWVAIRGGDFVHLIWGSVAMIDNWLAAGVVLIASGIWMSPFMGWFLFVSTFAKRMPFLMAFLPPIVLGFLEYLIFKTTYFAQAVGGRGDLRPLFHDMDVEHFFDEERLKVNEEAISLLKHVDIAGFLASPSLWTGIVVCAVFVAAAIYVRRYRDESQ
jgi:ABC-2 type transport system permease protein